MPNLVNTQWKGKDAVLVETFDATEMLDAPFTVLLKESVKQVADGHGEVIETIIPDPDGLVKAVAQSRVLNPHKLSGVELKFLRSAMGMKSKEFAQAIRVTPEHMSRLEAGDKILAPQSEMLVRIYTFVATLPFTSRKESEALKIAESVANVFCDLSIKPCRLVDDKVVLVLTRGRRVTPADDSDPDDSGLWDDETSSDEASSKVALCS